MNKKDITKQGFKVEFYVGQGPGGQHRNKTQSACRITHIETGIVVTNDDTRVQRRNMEYAYADINNQLKDQKKVAAAIRMQEYREAALENGRVRTYDFTQGVVRDHRTGKVAPLKKVLNGQLDLLK